MFPTLKASFFTLICREQWPIFPYECAQRSRRLIRMSRSIRPARRRFAHSRTVEIVAYFRRGPPIVLSSWRAQLILAPRLSMALPRRGKAHDRNNRPIRQIYATRIFSWKIESVPGCSPVIHSSPRPVKGDAFAFPQDTRARARVGPSENNCSYQRAAGAKESNALTQRKVDYRTISRISQTHHAFSTFCSLNNTPSG